MAFKCRSDARAIAFLIRLPSSFTFISPQWIRPNFWFGEFSLCLILLDLIYFFLPVSLSPIKPVHEVEAFFIHIPCCHIGCFFYVCVLVRACMCVCCHAFMCVCMCVTEWDLTCPDIDWNVPTDFGAQQKPYVVQVSHAHTVEKSVGHFLSKTCWRMKLNPLAVHCDLPKHKTPLFLQPGIRDCHLQRLEECPSLNPLSIHCR